MNTSSEAWRALLTWLLNELISHSFSAFEANQSNSQSLITGYILSFIKRFLFSLRICFQLCSCSLGWGLKNSFLNTEEQ